MDINKKLSLFSITVAVISIIVSFVFVPRINFKRDTPQIGEDISDIVSDAETQEELTKTAETLLKDLNRESQSKFYTDFCASAEEVNDSVKTKKNDLKKYAAEILTQASACRDEIKKTVDSQGISLADRLETLKNFSSSEKKKALDTAVANAEKTKHSIENEIKTFKETEAKKQAETQQSKPSDNSGSTVSDGNSLSDKSSGGGSSGGNSYSGNSYGGNSYSEDSYDDSGSYSDNYSSESYSDSYSDDYAESYSESYSSESYSDGGSSDEYWGGSER